MVVIDATTLLLMLRPETPINRPKERIEHLVKQLEKTRTKLIVPTPALSEALVGAGAAASQQIVDYLLRYSVFQIEPFDLRAAIELSAMTRTAKNKSSKRADSAATWAKVKFDRQIVAIAKVCGATTIYSDDGDLRAIAKETEIKVLSVADIDLPPEDPQGDIFAQSAPLGAGATAGDQGARHQGASKPEAKQ